MNRISYIFHRPTESTGATFSLAPEHSDSFENQTILNSLIGTLVKYGISGRIEPYLAASWQTSTDGLRWEFVLWDSLRCEDGTFITAPAYADQLRRQLKRYAERGKVMAFEHLRGWTRFIKDHDARELGISTDGQNKIVFEFDQKPQELLEFLRMVYFGFWCDSNFVDGKFRTDGAFSSSGAYQLVSNEDGKKLVMRAIPDWFAMSPDSATELEFSSKNIQGRIASYEKTIVRLGVSGAPLDDIDRFHVVRTAPMILTAFVLSPWTQSAFFRSEQNRKVFLSRLRKTQMPKSLRENGIYPSSFFYANSPSNVRISKIEDSTYSYAGEKILVSLPTRLGQSSKDYVKGLLIELLNGVPADKIQLVNVDLSQPGEAKKLLSNQHFDLRVASVDIGGNLLNAAIDMMFCTTLGISFPDLSGRICSLVKEYNRRGLEADSKYIEEFNQALVDDAVVLPLFHSGLTWLYSKDFDPQSIPSGTAHPQFEALKFIK